MRGLFSFALACVLAAPMWMSQASAADLVTAIPTAAASAAVGDQELARLRAEQHRLLKQLRQQLAALAPLPAPSDLESDDLKAQRAKRAQLQRLLETIERRVRLEASPRTRFSSSLSNEPEWLGYYARLKSRIEASANEDFPKEGTKPLYGRVEVAFVLDAIGQLVSVDIHSSTSTPLAKYSQALLSRLQPYEPFPPKLRQDVDHVVVTIPFIFERRE